MERRLYRSRNDRIIAGVCGGIAEQMQVDPTLVRIAAVLLTLITQGGLVIAYIVMAFVVPEEPVRAEPASAPAASQPAGTIAEEKIMAEDTTRSSEHDAPPVAPEVPPAPQVPVAPPAYVPPGAPATPPVRRGRGGVGFGVVLVLIGLALLANQFVPDFDIWRYWPVAIILLGIVSVMRGLRG
jgi:phage shock protein PspC (stress-responsive transcriptional regulator)